MASTIFVDKVDPQSGTALEIGSSGDTMTVPSGATLAIASGATITNSGTATGFGETNTPAFMVKKNDSQTVSDATWTTLTFETEVFDTDNTFASNRFTPGVTGKYLLCVFVYAYADGGSLEGTGIGLKFLKNGSTEGYTYSPSTTSNQTGVFFSRVVESDTDDYFDAQVNINVASGTPTANDQAFFYGYKLIT
tara:strand:- start:69 stop:647 length:579 start_codon:yes stop_codon:yes gene_type:complete